jgi:transposase
MKAKKERQTRRTFTTEFKEQAVRIVEEGSLPIRTIAKDLGVHVTQLQKWCASYREHAEQAFPGRGNRRELEAKIARLERTLRVKEQEVELLKKATAFFAREH